MQLAGGDLQNLSYEREPYLLTDGKFALDTTNQQDVPQSLSSWWIANSLNEFEHCNKDVALT